MARKFLLASFEDRFQQLLLSINEYVSKRDFDKSITSRMFKIEGSSLYEKKTEQQVFNLAKTVTVITLEQFLGIPLYFPNEWKKIAKSPHQYFRDDVIAEFYGINNSDSEIHILILFSLLDAKSVNDIEELLCILYGNSREAMRLDIFVDLIAIPSVVAEGGYIEPHIEKMKANALKVLNLIEPYHKQSHMFFLQNTYENGTPVILTDSRITQICGDFMISLLSDYKHIVSADAQLNGKIGVIAIENIELNKFDVINSWTSKILKKEFSPFFCRKKRNQEDHSKIKDLAKRFLEDIKKTRPDIHSNSDILELELKRWKDSVTDKLKQLSLDHKMSTEDIREFLSVLRLSYNMSSDKVIELDKDKIQLLDDFYAEYLTSDILNENPFVGVRNILSQIHEQFDNIEKQEKKVELFKRHYNPNYESNGEWIDDSTIKIGDQEFRTFKRNDIVAQDDANKGEYILKPEILKGNRQADLHKFFPKIKNQGSQGACASFSLVSVAEYYIDNQNDLSEAFVYYNARKERGECNEDNGATLEDVIASMVNDGLCRESLCPYNEEVYSKQPSIEAYKDALKCKATGSMTVPIDVDSIKSAIIEGFPVVACFRIFDSLKDNCNGYVPMPTEADFLGKEKYHAMVICGFNDNSRYFLVRNSWGEGFGDKGYCYIPYGFVRDKRLIVEAIIVKGIVSAQVGHIPDLESTRNCEDDNNVKYIVSKNVLQEEIRELDDSKKKLTLLLERCKEIVETLDFDKLMVDKERSTEKECAALKERAYALEEELGQLSVLKYRGANILFGMGESISVAATFYLFVNEFPSIYKYISAIVSTSVLATWVTYLFLKKEKDCNLIKTKLDDIDMEIKQKQKTLIEYKKFCINLKHLLYTIEDISSFTEEKQNGIDTLFKQWDEMLEKLSNFDLLLPNEFDTEYKKTDFDFIEIVNNLVWKADEKYPNSLSELQVKLLDYFNSKYNKKIEDVISEEMFEQFKTRIENIRTLAHLKYIPEEERIEMPVFLSNRSAEELPQRCSYCELNNNMYIFTLVKYVSPKYLVLFN